MLTKKTFIFAVLFLAVVGEVFCTLPKEGEILSLERMIDIALRNNPKTRETWALTWASYWRYRQTTADNYPYIQYLGIGNYRRVSATEENRTDLTYNQNLILTYLIFDFGVRAATQKSAFYSFLAANYFRDWTIQNVILDTIERYTMYLDAVESMHAREADLEDAKLNFEVAQAYYEAGVKNVVDALQSKTAFINSELILEEAKGAVEVAMSRLKTTLGLPMTLVIHPQELPKDFVPQEIAFQIEKLLETAIVERSDLWSSYSEILRREADLQRANADGWPTLNLEWNIGRRHGGARREHFHTDAALLLSVPLYRGYFYESGKKRACYDLVAQKAVYDENVLDASLDVSANYWNFKTAYKTYTYSTELLKNAEQSYEVTLANYKAGISGIELLFDAQNALAVARNEHIQTQTQWMLSLARLIHAIGMLNGSGPLFRDLDAQEKGCTKKCLSIEGLSTGRLPIPQGGAQ